MIFHEGAKQAKYTKGQIVVEGGQEIKCVLPDLECWNPEDTCMLETESSLKRGKTFIQGKKIPTTCTTPKAAETF